MYWPVGGPRVYSTTRNPQNDHSVDISDDGLGTDRVKTELGSNGGLEEAEKREELEVVEEGVNDDELEGDTANGTIGYDTSERPGLDKIEGRSIKNASERVLAEKIIALRLSRSGHMFASITKSTITIWQTKVSCMLQAIKHFLTIF
jgi:hypothetical protein